MKGFLKFLGTVAAIFTAILGAITVYDRFANRNAIKTEYLDCSDSLPHTEDDDK